MKNKKLFKDKSPEGQAIYDKLADTQMRIYKLYKDYVMNDLEREKNNLKLSLKHNKEDRKKLLAELQALRDENSEAQAAVQRYKQLVDNFEEEHDQVE